MTISVESTPTLVATTQTRPRQAAACPTPAGTLGVSFVDSTILSRRVAYSVYLPPCYGSDPGRNYPVIYLLHGANTDHTQWPDLRVQPEADALINSGAVQPFIVMMPGGDYRQGEDYGAFVLQDLIPHVEQTLHTSADGRHRAIGGISQGGFLALGLALAHPDLFSAAGGHSPATGPTLNALLSSNRPPGQDTLRIYLDVGDQDPLAPGVESFASTLKGHGLTTVFHIYPGGHNRSYWRSHTSEYLAFYAQEW